MRLSVQIIQKYPPVLKYYRNMLKFTRSYGNGKIYHFKDDIINQNTIKEDFYTQVPS